MTLEAKEDLTLARLLSHMKAVRERWASVVYMKESLRLDDDLMFLEAWHELDKETQIALWHAPKYGGVWTTIERTQMRKMWGMEMQRAIP